MAFGLGVAEEHGAAAEVGFEVCSISRRRCGSSGVPPPGQPIHFSAYFSVDTPSKAATRPPEDFVICSPTVTGRRLETLMIVIISGRP
jgi:hypothetical protein